MDRSQRETLWLRRVRDLSHRLAREDDLSALAPEIVDAAIELTEAERGFLVLATNTEKASDLQIHVLAGRGFGQNSLQGETGRVSRRVVQRVLQEERGVVTCEEQDQDLLGITSVQSKRVLSIICTPMYLRGSLRGALYLDHRFKEDAFSPEDLPILGTFADQAALALETAELRTQVDTASTQVKETRAELEALRKVVAGPKDRVPMARAATRFGQLVGRSQAMLDLYAEIERVARSSDPVLVTGESGVGKSLAAQEIHARSARHEEPFVSQSCASVDANVLESELFGHRRGAFAGATSSRRGLLARAAGGTLLLDEIADLPSSLQAKLLNLLEEGSYRPLGGDKTLPLACRIVATTQRDLAQLVKQGKFRADLFYRLDVLRVRVPSLRERQEDVDRLLCHFAAEREATLEFTAEALERLRAYAWPGNVRELANQGRRLLSLRRPVITVHELSEEVRTGRVAGAATPLVGKTLPDMEREMVRAALEACKGNKSRAARQLGIPRSTLYHLIERYKLG